MTVLILVRDSDCYSAILCDLDASLTGSTCGKLELQISTLSSAVDYRIGHNAYVHAGLASSSCTTNFCNCGSGHRAVQQLDAVEVGGVGDAVDLALELIDLLLELLAVGAVLKGAVGGLLGQLIHAVEHVVDLGQGALGGLHQGDAVLGVVLGLVQAGDLGAHLLGDGEAGGVVAGAVDLVAGGQLLQVLGQGGGVVGVVAVGVHRHNIVLNTHDVLLSLTLFSGRFLPPGPQGWWVAQPVAGRAGRADPESISDRAAPPGTACLKFGGGRAAVWTEDAALQCVALSV